MGFNIFKLGSKKSEKENNNPSGRSRKITSENVQLGDDCDVREAEHAYSVPTASKKNFGPKSLPAFAPRNRHEFVKKQVFGGDHFYESNRHCPKKEFNGEFNFRANQSMQQKNNMNNSMFVQRHDALSSRDQNRTFEYGSDEQSPLTLRHFNNYHRENEKHDCMIAEEYENNDNSDLDGTVSHRHSSNISRVPNNKAPSHKQKHDLCEDLKELSDKCKYFKRKYREHKERSSRLEDKMTICMTKYHNINSQLHDTKSMYKHAQDKCIALEDRLKMVEAELEKQRQIYIYQSSTAGYKKANSVLKSGSIEKMSTLNGSEIHVNSGTNSISDFTNFHIHNQNGAQPNNVRFSVNQAIPSQHYATIDDESKKLRSQKEDKYYIEASVASAHGGGNRGSRQGNNRRGPPMPIFLKGLSGTEIREFLAIRRNNTLTKAEVTTSEDAWAAKQTPEILTTYNEFKVNMTTYNTNLKTKYDAAAQNLTAEAKAVYNQIETIRLNQNISYKQENTDIQKIMGETTQEIRQALMRLLVSCAFKGREGSNTNRLPNFNGNSFQQGGTINIQPIQAGSNMQFGSFKNRQ